MSKCKTIILFFFVVFSLDVFAWGTLKSQEVNGFSRYCSYSDGGVLTVNSSDLCPINNSAQSKNNGSPTITIQNRNAGFGSLTNQKINGFNRYCYYSDGTVLTVNNTDLCPISSK
ncbi:hypothetical protein E2R68_06310 [Psychromonas sp. RZ22]|uniref:hypothetical protein n=1 Tax=Psychromonas algarum TaxID=2555643 RepID=UPI00106821FD|nr:hypothetical protein [Psychromonas sp. RZ22]TEW55353.1 hypothetical protein E2R68_06310 [Psychromonas sp. RZ22]